MRDGIDAVFDNVETEAPFARPTEVRFAGQWDLGLTDVDVIETDLNECRCVLDANQ
jgi:hypothetical protein